MLNVLAFTLVPHTHNANVINTWRQCHGDSHTFLSGCQHCARVPGDNEHVVSGVFRLLVVNMPVKRGNMHH